MGSLTDETIREVLDRDERKGNIGRRDWARQPVDHPATEYREMLFGACDTIDRLLNRVQELEASAREVAELNQPNLEQIAALSLKNETLRNAWETSEADRLHTVKRAEELEREKDAALTFNLELQDIINTHLERIRELEVELARVENNEVALGVLAAERHRRIWELEREVATEKERTSLMYGRWEEAGKRADELQREVEDWKASTRGLAKAGLMLPDKDVGLVLRIVTGCCHFNDNGWCVDHSGGRHTSNYCDKAHEQASQAVADARERLT